MKSYCQKVQFLRGPFLTKKLSVPGGNFSNYFMKILVFSLLYRSKSATLEIAYDMKIDFLLCNLYFPLNQQSAKTIRTYIQIKSASYVGSIKSIKCVTRSIRQANKGKRDTELNACEICTASDVHTLRKMQMRIQIHTYIILLSK